MRSDGQNYGQKFAAGGRRRRRTCADRFLRVLDDVTDFGALELARLAHPPAAVSPGRSQRGGRDRRRAEREPRWAKRLDKSPRLQEDSGS